MYNVLLGRRDMAKLFCFEGQVKLCFPDFFKKILRFYFFLLLKEPNKLVDRGNNDLQKILGNIRR